MSENDPNKNILKRFDMYRFFSRVDVILAILLTLGVLGYVLYTLFFATPDLA